MVDVLKWSIWICIIGIAIYVSQYYKSETTKLDFGDIPLTEEENQKWHAFTAWLHANGVPEIKLNLAKFNNSGRGVVVSEDINEGDSVVVIPFSIMMNSGKMGNTKLGKAILAVDSTLTEDVFLAICLLYERIRGNSFWKAYIDLLPTEFPTLPLYYTASERSILDGPVKAIYDTQQTQLKQAIHVAAMVEDEYHEFTGISDFEGQKWAISAVRSRMWMIRELPGRTLVPLADMLNHNPSRGVALDTSPEKKTGTIKSRYQYKKGSEFFDKYYTAKIDSDSLYLMTFGFLLNGQDISTIQIHFNYALVKYQSSRALFQHFQCGEIPDVLSDVDEVISPHFTECLYVLSLQDFYNDDTTIENYPERVTKKVEQRAYKWMEIYFTAELSKFNTPLATLENNLLQPNLTFNMQNIIKVQITEIKVLNHALDLLNRV